jgi:hypothetical protein
MLKLGISYPDLIKFHYFANTKQNEKQFYHHQQQQQNRFDLATCQEQLAKTSHIRWHRLLTLHKSQLISFTYDTCTSFQHPPAMHHAGWMMME